MKAYTFILLLTALVFAGCDSLGGDDGDTATGRVAVQFGVDPSAAKTGTAAKISGATTLSIPGNNGTLEIDRIAFIVSELELEGDDDACEDGGDDDCAEFESGAFFVDLALDGTPVRASVDDVRAGTYDELEFEIENLDFDDDEEFDDDEDDIEEREALAAVEAAIASSFDSWPEDASLFVEGRFISSDGAPRPYRAFFDAEVEIEEEFATPLVVDATTNTSITVDISPAGWFLRSNGDVIDLSAFDFDATGRVAEIEVEIERGFAGVDFEDDEDDDHDDDDDEEDDDHDDDDDDDDDDD